MNWVDGYETFCIQLEEYVSGGNSYAYDVLDVAEEPDAEPRPFRSRSGGSFTTAVTIPPSAKVAADEPFPLAATTVVDPSKTMSAPTMWAMVPATATGAAARRAY